MHWEDASKDEGVEGQLGIEEGEVVHGEGGAEDSDEDEPLGLNA